MNDEKPLMRADEPREPRRVSTHYDLVVGPDNILKLPGELVGELELMVDAEDIITIVMIPLEHGIQCHTTYHRAVDTPEHPNKNANNWHNTIFELMKYNHLKGPVQQVDLDDDMLKLPEELFKPGDEVRLLYGERSFAISYLLNRT